MTYRHIREGIFRARPNRFLAHVEMAEGLCVCHVKNTGRCRELLTEGAKVYLEESDNLGRKTKYDLVAVEKGPLLINMDSQAPNKAAAEFFPNLFPGLRLLRPETKFGNSRFDFYIESETERWFWEVKGVTLEQDGTALFPDAPTERGVKHVKELCTCLKLGYRAGLLFVVQMKGPTRFSPNTATHPEFAKALEEAAREGVSLLAMDCLVTPRSMTIDQPVKICLS